MITDIPWFQEFNNGLLIQYGFSLRDGTHYTIYFPTSFSIPTSRIFLSAHGNIKNDDYGNYIWAYTTTRFEVELRTGGTYATFALAWLAIGN